MNLQGSILRLQKIGVDLYVDLAQYFRENNLIRDTWDAMAQDELQQITGLDALPRSFWNRLRREQNGLLQAIHSSSSSQATEKPEDRSLRRCFARTLDFEEPVILRVYVPLIRQLRQEWTGKALDFYIMVKAHLARINRVTEAFSGDPLLTQRSAALLQEFEKQVQVPQVKPKVKVFKGKTRVSRSARAGKMKERLPAKISNRARARRPKPLFEKISLRRRRARR